MGVNVDEKLGLLTYKADHSNAHIKIKDESPCLNDCKDKTCTFVCPAKVYSWEESQKKIIVSYENCIECGACRMLCPFDNIACDWPRGGFGVQYKMG
ncbi:MAG: Ferredoxin-like protein FixX [Elusimicrobia bacterium]|nr:Ferredoxin-like protein FixX [Elusimicrobiota bacterium]